MNILAMYYGAFPDVDRLYSRLSRGRNKIKIVVDIDGNLDTSRESFLALYRDVVRLFPSLAKHSCCEQWESDSLKISEEADVSVRRIGELADIPHLLEHLIVDLQCSVGQMAACSGVTCGWTEPQNRFDLFIECDDPRIGVFAACFAAHVMNNYLAGIPGEDDFQLMLKIAKLIQQYPETKAEIARLATSLNESVENINIAIQQLAEFNFFALEAEEDNEE